MLEENGGKAIGTRGRVSKRRQGRFNIIRKDVEKGIIRWGRASRRNLSSSHRVTKDGGPKGRGIIWVKNRVG